ncbi:hypothetical protein [Streptococcus sp.]|nr:hypothetical protein [Streptococcus sp.]
MTETQLIETLVNFILSDISDTERDIVVQAKTDLENRSFSIKLFLG